MELALCSVRQAALHNHEDEGELPRKCAAGHHVEELLVEKNQVASGEDEVEHAGADPVQLHQVELAGAEQVQLQHQV